MFIHDVAALNKRRGHPLDALAVVPQLTEPTHNGVPASTFILTFTAWICLFRAASCRLRRILTHFRNRLSRFHVLTVCDCLIDVVTAILVRSLA